ncbi:GDP-mannose 4,6-dehydratase, partial [bacterium M00.F.Ca.ET.180.01.1.1]
PAKAQASLGWEATISLEEMIHEMMDADLARHSAARR